MNPVNRSLTEARILHIAFCSSWVLFLFLLFSLRPEEHPVAPAIVTAFALVNFMNVGVALYFRSKYITASVETLRINPQDAAVMTKWRMGNLFSFAMAESVTLFGLVLKLLGAEWRIAGVFFAVGLLLLLLWTPRLDI